MTNPQQNQKAVLITGAGSGIGAATAKLFSENGYFVYLLGRTEANLKKVAQNLSSSQTLACDLRNPAQVKSIAQQVCVNPKIQLEILVNNAGIFQRHKFAEGSDDVWMSQWETNMMGSVRMTRELFPYFMKNNRGSIVNVSSTLGLRPSSEVSAYSATKAAMVNWTHSLALEGAPYNIRANCICPGLVDTPIHQFHSFAQNEKEKVLDSLKNIQPLGRVGTSEEIAQSIFFLAAEHSSWTAGATLSVDGGINVV